LITHRKTIEDKPSKLDEQKPVDMQMVSFVVVASVPPPLAGACLTAYSNVDTMSFAQWILRYLESLKDAEADQEGNMSSSTSSGCLFFY
jgi:hypothetical protein